MTTNSMFLQFESMCVHIEAQIFRYICVHIDMKLIHVSLYHPALWPKFWSRFASKMGTYVSREVSHTTDSHVRTYVQCTELGK